MVAKGKHCSGCQETETPCPRLAPARGPLASHLISLGYSSLLKKKIPVILGPSEGAMPTTM